MQEVGQLMQKRSVIAGNLNHIAQKKGRFIFRTTQCPTANAKAAAVPGSITASYAPTQWNLRDGR